MTAYTSEESRLDFPATASSVFPLSTPRASRVSCPRETEPPGPPVAAPPKEKTILHDGAAHPRPSSAGSTPVVRTDPRRKTGEGIARLGPPPHRLRMFRPNPVGKKGGGGDTPAPGAMTGLGLELGLGLF